MLLETLTVAGFAGLVGNLAQNLLGGLAHDKYQELTRHIWDRIPGLSGLPANHDIARAVRLAQLHALARVLQDYEEFNPAEWRQDPAKKPEIFLSKARSFISSQLPLTHQIEVVGELGLKAPVDAGVRAIHEALREYSSGSKAADEHLRRLAENAVLDELRHELGHVSLPADFERRFRAEEPICRGWFDLFSAFLVEQLKLNSRFRNILLFDILGNLTEFGLEQRDVLRALTERLNALTDRIVSQFERLTLAFGVAISGIRSEIRDYSLVIEDKTRDFVGRQSVFTEIERFITSDPRYPRGYFVIHGEPGIGKTAVAAQLVKTKGYVHHFNSRSNGIIDTAQCLRNICAQIIAKYKLNELAESKFLSDPRKAGEDCGLLLELLGAIPDEIRQRDHVVLVIDALDEAKVSDSNVLALPDRLPLGVYIIATQRKGAKVKLHIECEQHPPLYMDAESDENKADIRNHLAQAAKRPRIRSYTANQNTNEEYFIDLLSEKSQGNFMYLHFVLLAIEEGLYHDLALKELPEGLQEYYEQHWSNIRGKDSQAWFKYKLPVIMVLSAAIRPIPISLIQQFSKVRDRNFVIDALQEWRQFLDISPDKRYSLYHASFQDFLTQKDELEEGVSRFRARMGIINSIMH